MSQAKSVFNKLPFPDSRNLQGSGCHELWRTLEAHLFWGAMRSESKPTNMTTLYPFSLSITLSHSPLKKKGVHSKSMFLFCGRPLLPKDPKTKKRPGAKNRSKPPRKGKAKAKAKSKAAPPEDADQPAKQPKRRKSEWAVFSIYIYIWVPCEWTRLKVDKCQLPISLKNEIQSQCVYTLMLVRLDVEMWGTDWKNTCLHARGAAFTHQHSMLLSNLPSKPIASIADLFKNERWYSRYSVTVCVMPICVYIFPIDDARHCWNRSWAFDLCLRRSGCKWSRAPRRS